MSRPLITLIVALSACAGHTTQTSPPSESTPRLVVISIDGFRWDYLERYPTPRLRALAVAGVRAARLVPAFPTKTFPNHYTIATGLYPEHHGIVANSMWDSAIGRRFVNSDTLAVSDPRWWGGEPIWVTAILQGRRAATMFWPGSEAPIKGVYPTSWHRFDAQRPAVVRFNQALAWLDQPRDSAPQLILMYLNEVDFVAHKAGLDSPELAAAVARTDGLIGAFVDSLAARQLTNQVNLIVLSDHGVTPNPPDRMIYLDDYLDLAAAEIHDLNPVAAIEPKPGLGDSVYRALRGAHPHLAVYRKAEIPERFRFRAHPRITSIIAVAGEGWTITTRHRPPYTDVANHGYDPDLESMGALFLAAGPDFRADAVVGPLRSVHLYEVMAHLLRLRPAPNDGSLDSIRAVLARP
ncbi:MAG: ectonucleotide pyrophosphatase/phosphodiesterase [Gemmatimonadales bacterium]